MLQNHSGARCGARTFVVARCSSFATGKCAVSNQVLLVLRVFVTKFKKSWMQQLGAGGMRVKHADLHGARCVYQLRKENLPGNCESAARQNKR